MKKVTKVIAPIFTLVVLAVGIILVQKPILRLVADVYFAADRYFNSVTLSEREIEQDARKHQEAVAIFERTLQEAIESKSPLPCSRLPHSELFFNGTYFTPNSGGPTYPHYTDYTPRSSCIYATALEYLDPNLCEEVKGMYEKDRANRFQVNKCIKLVVAQVRYDEGRDVSESCDLLIEPSESAIASCKAATLNPSWNTSQDRYKDYEYGGSQ